jgi:hypothetical protein
MGLWVEGLQSDLSWRAAPESKTRIPINNLQKFIHLRLSPSQSTLVVLALCRFAAKISCSNAGINMALTGNELLKLMQENAGTSVKELAEKAGYTTTTKTGKVRVKMLEFQHAVLSASKITILPG